MQGVGKLHHHATGKYGTGHTILKASVYYRGVTIPCASLLYIKQEHANSLNIPFIKLTELAAKGENNNVAIVTDDLSASMIKIVTDYLKRWSIEMLIKDEKQHLGLGDYQVLRYEAVVRHLRLVDCAYACLTHVGIKSCRAQGQKKSKKVLRLEPISRLKDKMRRIVWQENIKDVVKYSHEKIVISRLEKLLAA